MSASAPQLASPVSMPIGGDGLRFDSRAKVTGQTCYVEDIEVPGLLHAAVLRSPHPHARLVALDVTAARELPQVVRVVTAADIPGLNGLDGYSRAEPVLTPVGDTLRQRGAPIALVVARSLPAARAALRAIACTYEPLPPVTSLADAMTPDAVAIYPDGNFLNDYAIVHGNLAAAWQTSTTLIETEYQTTFQAHAALERETTLAYRDEAGRLTVVGGTHEPHWQVDYIAHTLGLPAEEVRVIMPPTGGSFGGRQDPWPLVAVGLLAFLTGAPVRLTYSRREVFDATPKRHPYTVRLKIGAAGERLTGIQARIDVDTGGYDSAGYWIPNYAVTASGGAYTWQAVDAQAQVYYTNGPKCGQFRGYGSPQSAFALECSLDELAQRLAVDPLALRRQNLLQAGATSFLGYPVGETLGYAEVLAALEPRYRALLAEAEGQNAAGDERRWAVGLAGMWYRFGKSGSLQIEAQAELTPDGRFTIYCSAPDYGQGIGTVMLQLAADALGLPRARVEMVNADSALTPDSGIQGASRATYFTGGAVVRAVANLRARVLAVAAELLDVDPAGLYLATERPLVIDASGAALPLTEVAAELDRTGQARRVSGVFDLGPQFPPETRPEYLPLMVTGAQAALVEVDTQTGLAQVHRVVAAHDVGRVINSRDAIGQIQGAIVMGVGTALSEAYLPGATTGFTDYILPMIHAAPEIEVLLIEVPSHYGPLGAKGLGEAAILPTAPAVLNGLSRALGTRLRQLPATPERILAALGSLAA
jgi:CO/xanthine dehydrogenase Mo-binding subunit